MCIRDSFYGGYVDIPDEFLFSMEIDSISIGDSIIKGNWNFDIQVTNELVKGEVDEYKLNESLNSINAVSYTHLDVYNRQEYGRIKEGVKECTKISIITSIIAGAVLIFLGKYFVMMFISNPDEEILRYAQQVLDISAIFFIPLGLIFIYRNCLLYTSFTVK